LSYINSNSFFLDKAKNRSILQVAWQHAAPEWGFAIVLTPGEGIYYTCLHCVILNCFGCGCVNASSSQCVRSSVELYCVYLRLFLCLNYACLPCDCCDSNCRDKHGYRTPLQRTYNTHAKRDLVFVFSSLQPNTILHGCKRFNLTPITSCCSFWASNAICWPHTPAFYTKTLNISH
jgi:hypothetical protein